MKLAFCAGQNEKQTERLGSASVQGEVYYDPSSRLWTIFDQHTKNQLQNARQRLAWVGVCLRHERRRNICLK